MNKSTKGKYNYDPDFNIDGDDSRIYVRATESHLNKNKVKINQNLWKIQ
jgi:hypothetical protein